MRGVKVVFDRIVFSSSGSTEFVGSHVCVVSFIVVIVSYVFLFYSYRPAAGRVEADSSTSSDERQ